MSALRLLSIGCCSALLAGCIDLPDFPSSSIVEGPRVLAIIAEPPEIGPGSALTMTVLVAGAESFEVEFQVCGAFDMMFGGSQFGEMDEEDCSQSSAVLSAKSASDPEVRGGLASARWEVPAAVVDAVWSDRDLAASVLGDALPAETLARVLREVGVPVLVEATVQIDGRSLRAVKRVLLSENAARNANPPPPDMEFAGVRVRATQASPWSCTREDGRRLHARRGSDIVIAPAVSGDTEEWVESYRVIDARGELQDRTERAFYSWYATGGELDQQVTRAPLRNQVWTAPGRVALHRLWMIVRDGHGGTSACGLEIDVD